MDDPLKRRPEPIAIVGMGCRLPGKVNSPTDLWDLIMARGIANSARVPANRFNIDAHFHENNERPGSFSVPGGYFLHDDLEDFDPVMFDISPVEAAWMDPQQRKLLEVVYEAFENSGCTLGQVANEMTGCFVGCFTNDFQQMALKEPDFRHSYATTGIDPGILGNRISHVFNLRGPSVLLNTACSSSMYALHAACSSIRSGECEGAVVAGSNLIMTVDQHMNTAKLGVLSPTSTCHTFDESADGYGRAEGVGALYIKRLDIALKNGDPIRAIIRSTATNANGRVPDSGITHPSLQGQIDVMSAAYKLGNLDPKLTSYIECHGTGTQIGDPIEVRAISKAMRTGERTEDPILIGSVKPNIGHSEAASSISTIIKAVLAIENEVIPPTAGLAVPNKKIKWDEWQVKVVTEPTLFSPYQPIRRIGVSAFGYGGTNGHAIIDNVESLVSNYRGHKFVHPAGPYQRDLHNEYEDRSHLLVFSAHDKATLKRNLDAYSSLGATRDLLDLAYTLASHRTKHACRTFAVCREQSYTTSIAEAGENTTGPSGRATVAFVFTGQGAQWPEMGARLLQLYPSFLTSIRKLDRHLATLPDAPDWTLEASLLEPSATSCVHDPEFSQPLCTAIQIALVDLLRRWGVTPVAAVGHSSGEIAAAYSAWIISAENAITASYYRGKAVRSVKLNGAMLAVGLGATDVLAYVEKYDGRVVVACHNSPRSTTISGDSSTIDELRERLTADKIFTRVVHTGGKAYHSHHMKDVALEYEGYLKSSALISPRKPSQDSTCQMVSSVTGTSMDGRVPDPVYWTQNLLSPVLFNQAVQRMMTLKPSINLVVELGPHSALAGPFRQICGENKLNEVSYLPSLARNKHEGDQLLQLAGNLWARNASIDIISVTRVESRLENGATKETQGTLLVDLPPYQWTYKKKLWLEPPQSRGHRTQRHARHDILGRKVIGLSNSQPVWRNVLRHKDLPWLKHHSLGGECVFPAAAYFAMAIEAITQMNTDSTVPEEITGYTLRNIAISVALVVPNDNDGIETLFSLQTATNKSVMAEDGLSNHWYDFTVSSHSYGIWKDHGKGTIGINKRSRGRTPVTPPNLPLHASYKSWNQRLRDLGFDFGHTFHGMTDIRSDGKSHAATSDMIIKQECGIMTGESRYVLHPACIDSCLQLFIVSIYAGRLSDVACGTVLTHFDEVSIWPPAPAQLGNSKASVHAWTPKRGNRAFLSNAQLIGPDGELLADFANVRCLSYEAAVPQQLQSTLRRAPYMELQWKQDTEYLKPAEDVGPLSRLDMGGLIDLFVHKNASLKILVLDAKFVPAILEAHPSVDLTITAHSEGLVDYKALKLVQLDTALGLAEQRTAGGAYDLILASEISVQGHLKHIYHLLSPGGSFLLQKSMKSGTDWDQYLKSAGFSEIQHMSTELHNPSALIISTAVKYQLSLTNGIESGSPSRNLLLLYRKQPTRFFRLLKQQCTKHGWSVRVSPIISAKHQPAEHVMMLADLEGPLLATLEDEEFDSIQHITDNASSIVWVTCGGLISGLKPEYGMTSGFARVLRSEKQALDLVTLDFDLDISPDEKVIEVLLNISTRQTTVGMKGETEYCIDRGVVHIARLVPSRTMNGTFAAGEGEPKLASLDSSPALKGILQSGRIFFQNDERVATTLERDNVEIRVMAIGINEDTFVASGSDDSTAFSHEVAGFVTKVGPDVSNVSIGQRVVGFAFDTLATYQRTRAILVHPIADSDPFQAMVTLPMAFAAALYALHDLARVETGEVVLILDGCGPAGLAALQLCGIAQARAVIATKSENTKTLLLNHGLSHERIIYPGKEDVLIQIQRATAGRGPDIILSSGSTDPSLSYECSRSLAPFGRFVTFGKPDASMPSLSNMATCARGCGLFAFNLRDLYLEKPHILSRLLAKCVSLYNHRKISAIEPFTLKDPSQISEVMSSFQNELGHGKIVIPYEPKSLFNVLPSRKNLQFRPDATYLLVGCLGGLGRSLTSWMIGKGAKHLAFISRSGTDNPMAAALIESIQALGVHTLVLRADVTSRTQVEAAIQLVDTSYPIRGVVNAAVAMRDGFFHNMTIDGWRQVQEPKLKGSLNLHQVFTKQHELDFFVMTSSISATLGSTGQSNYAAANSFLDALAHHRRVNGLAGVSLILPMVLGVGYVAEHPEIEALVRQKGMYGIDVDEMLAAFEVAMAPQQQPAWDHVIAGLEPSQLAAAIAATNADVFWLEEPRLRTVRAAMAECVGKEGAAAVGDRDDSILATIARAEGTEEALQTISACLVERLSRLLMIGVEEFHQPETESTRSIASYGLDSMIGAEFRNWVFREFKVDVPFQQLLAGNLTVAKFATDLYEKCCGSGANKSMNHRAC